MTFLGYMRVSKNDGSQTLDLQRDALKAAGVNEERLYQDMASGKRDDRPGLQACLKGVVSANPRNFRRLFLSNFFSRLLKYGVHLSIADLLFYKFLHC